jgi:pimeloyl-ACP methyl ester carboxylesterase
MLGAGAALGVLAWLNYWARRAAGPVPRWGDGEPHFYQWRDGAVYYEAAGPEDGRPLLLIHGINAAASGYEMRRIFEPLAAAGFRVYLPDLLGFGRSERPRLAYTADTYVDLWCDFARDVAGAGDGGRAGVIASSLSAAHAVKAAARHPERFGGLLLICPTGIEALQTQPGLPGRLLRELLDSPVLGTALFNLLVTRTSLAAFLRRLAYAEAGRVTPELVSDYYEVSHQPGAKWAPEAFVSGYLNCAIADDFRSLPNPVHLVWGRAATITPLAQARAFRSLRPDADLAVIDGASLLPHDEQPAAFIDAALRALAVGGPDDIWTAP